MEWSLERDPAGAAEPEHVEVKTVEDGDAIVISVAGKILYDTSAVLTETLLPLAERPRPRLVVDMSNVTMCDSSGLNLLVQVHRRAVANGGWLRIAGPRPMVRKVLNVTRLDRVVSVYDNVVDAVADGD